MLTVGKDAREVDRKLRTGEFACPGCGGRLAPWSYVFTVLAEALDPDPPPIGPGGLRVSVIRDVAALA